MHPGAPRPAWHRGEVTVTDGWLTYHRTGGTGRVVVLCHGLGDNGLCWTRVAQALERDFDIVMLDARGHGRSSRCAAPWDPARDIAEAIEGLALTTPIVIGHSVGARAAADFAGRWPGSLSKLVLEDPPLLSAPTPLQAAERAEAFGARQRQFAAMTPDEILAIGWREHPTWERAEFDAWGQAKVEADPEAYPLDVRSWQRTFAAIEAPTLILHGDPSLGSLVRPKAALEARSLRPNIVTRLVSGAGHNVRRENFNGYLDALRPFLAEG